MQECLDVPRNATGGYAVLRFGGRFADLESWGFRIYDLGLPYL